MSPLHKQGEGISEKFTQLPRVTQMVNGEVSVELRRVQPQSCAVFPHSKQSHLKTKPVQDTPLSICPGDFLPNQTSAGPCPLRHLPASLATPPILLALVLSFQAQGHPTCYSLCPECYSPGPLQIPPPSSRSLLQCHLLRRPFPTTLSKRGLFRHHSLSSPYPAAHILGSTYQRLNPSSASWPLPDSPPTGMQAPGGQGLCVTHCRIPGPGPACSRAHQIGLQSVLSPLPPPSGPSTQRPATQQLVTSAKERQLSRETFHLLPGALTKKGLILHPTPLKTASPPCSDICSF